MVTKEELLKNGWKETGERLFPLEKEIENRNPLNNDPEDTEIKLVVHGMYNDLTIALMLPDGGLLNLNIETIDDLASFEKMIAFYDCPY